MLQATVNTLRTRVKPLLRSATAVLWPRMFWRIRVRNLIASRQPELSLLGLLCRPGQDGLDVGASTGLYSVNMLDHVRHCVAFEPRPRQARELRDMADAMKLRIRVEGVAVSDAPGQVELRILTRDPGRSTIETENALNDADGSESESVMVEARTLDSYGFDAVGFLKVDVEGHELAVLKGAKDLLSKQKPRIVVEIENRHRPNAVRDVFGFLEALNYAGYFVLDGQLRDLSSFDPAVHQDPKNASNWRNEWRRVGVYVNNFIFVPKAEEMRLATRMKQRLLEVAKS